MVDWTGDDLKINNPDGLVFYCDPSYGRIGRIRINPSREFVVFQMTSTSVMVPGYVISELEKRSGNDRLKIEVVPRDEREDIAARVRSCNYKGAIRFWD